MNEIRDFIVNFQSVQSIHIFMEGCCYLDAGRVYKNCILKQYEDQTNTDETM